MSGIWPERIRASLDWLARFPISLIQLAFRLALGDVFFHSGMLKLESWATTLVLFRDEYRVPVLPSDTAAYLATAVELTCPVFLALGLGARLATLPMLGTVAVIQLFVYPDSWNVHLIWTGILLLILTRGPGTIALDHLIARRFLA